MFATSPRVSFGPTWALRRAFGLSAPVLTAVALLACGDLAPPVPLEGLLLRDSVYLDAETFVPYSGPVVKTFSDDEGRVQLRGGMVDGMWNGEIVVYHANGRIRYQGWLDEGRKCGAWIENRDPTPHADVFAELKQEIESMGLYPPCPEEGG